MTVRVNAHRPPSRPERLPRPPVPQSQKTFILDSVRMQDSVVPPSFCHLSWGTSETLVQSPFHRPMQSLQYLVPEAL